MLRKERVGSSVLKLLELAGDRGGLGALYRDPGAPVQPQQQKWEFEKVLKLYKRLNPRTVLEIGTAEGGSLYQFMKHSLPGGLFVSVDNNFCINQWQEWTERFNHRFCFVRGDSTAPDTIDRVKSIIPGVDFLFIDGHHSYESVKPDFWNYGPLVRSGGLIVLHDIVHKEYGVHKFWAELCQEGYITQELLGCQDENEYGTGVVYDSRFS